MLRTLLHARVSLIPQMPVADAFCVDFLKYVRSVFLLVFYIICLKL
jgi:hypothetical protein